MNVFNQSLTQIQMMQIHQRLVERKIIGLQMEKLSADKTKLEDIIKKIFFLKWNWRGIQPEIDIIGVDLLQLS